MEATATGPPPLSLYASPLFPPKSIRRFHR